MDVPSSIRSSSPTVSITPCFHFPWTRQPYSQENPIEQVRTIFIKEGTSLLAAIEKTLWWSTQISNHQPDRAALEGI